MTQKTLKIDWNPGIWVLIWEYSARAIQSIPTSQGLDGYCDLDKVASALKELKAASRKAHSSICVKLTHNWLFTCIGGKLTSFSPLYSSFIFFWKTTACCVRCFKHSELSFVLSWASPSYKTISTYLENFLRLTRMLFLLHLEVLGMSLFRFQYIDNLFSITSILK